MSLYWERNALISTTLNYSIVHYADLGDVQQSKPLPGKANLWVKKIFSSNGHNICSSVYTRFPKNGHSLVQELGPPACFRDSFVDYWANFVNNTRKCISQSDARLASYKIVLKLANILWHQHIFYRIKGLGPNKTKKIWHKLNNPMKGWQFLNNAFYYGISA